MYMDKKEFSLRLAQLRENKEISARDMSLSIGMSENYICSIENGKSFPSMTGFFYICDFFGITPQEFFETEMKNPAKTKELIDAVKGLSTEQLDNLIALAKGLKK